MHIDLIKQTDEEAFQSENIVTKEEIAQNVQFLLLSQCFPVLYTVKHVLKITLELRPPGHNNHTFSIPITHFLHK